MREIKNLPIPQEGNLTEFPNGNIRNETETQTGSPVVREIYGDIIQSIYAVLRDAGISFNNQEDNVSNGFQFLQALKVFSNSLNDIEKVVSLGSGAWSVNMDLDNLPDRYVFLGRIANDFVSGSTYSFRGTGSNSYNVISDKNISASSNVIVVIDQSGVRFLPLGGSSSQTSDVLLTSFGSPLGYNGSDNLLYLSNGRVFNTTPNAYNTESLIRTFSGNSNLNVVDAVLHKSKLIVLCFDVSAIEYHFYSFDASDLGTVEAILTYNGDFNDTKNENPFLYADENNLYLTNQGNLSINDYVLRKLLFNPADSDIDIVSDANLDSNFEKTTNAFITGGNLLTFVDGNLYSYPLGGGSRSFVANFNTTNGQVFKFNKQTYYSSGEVGEKWNY